MSDAEDELKEAPAPYEMTRPITTAEQADEEGLAWGKFYEGRGPKPVMAPKPPILRGVKA